MRHALVKAPVLLGLALVVGAGATLAHAADTRKVDAATRQVEAGAKKIGEGKVLEGVEETAKGVGHTVVEGAKLTGEKFREAAQAAEPPARSSWQKVKEGVESFGRGVKNFFEKLFTN